MNAGILGMGIYIPEGRLTNQDLEKMVDTSDKWITQRTGIKERPVIDNNQKVSDMGELAAREAIKNAGIDPQEIELIVCATGSPEYIWPATACLIQKKLEIRNGCPAFDIQAACSGFVYGLSAASAYIKSGNYKKILLVCPEVMTRYVNYKDRDTCVLFGDGAGAAVLAPVENPFGVLGSVIKAEGERAELLTIPDSGSSRRILDDPCIQMNGREIYEFAIKSGISIIKEVLEKSRIELNKVKYVIPHQANKRITESIGDCLQIPEKMVSNIEKLGNTGAASIPIALYELFENGKLRKGDLIITVGFGAGLTWGANLIRWNLKQKRS